MSPFDGRFAAGAIAVGVVAASLFGAAMAKPSTGSFGSPLYGVAATVLAVAAWLCSLRWRLTGRAPALWTAVGIALAGPVAITVSRLGGVVGDDVARAAGGGALLAGVAALARAVHGPTVDTGIRPVRVLALLAPAATVAGVAVHAAGADFPVVTTAGAPDSWAATGLALAWAALGVSSLARATVPRPSWTLAWLALSSLVLAAHAVALLVAGGPAEPHAALLVVAAVPVAWGARADLHDAFVAQHALLWATHTRAADAADAIARQTHQARNALMAIAGATTTLERYRAELPSSARERLAEAVAGEVARLQRLLDAEDEVASALATPTAATSSAIDLTEPSTTTDRAASTAAAPARSGVTTATSARPATTTSNPAARRDRHRASARSRGSTSTSTAGPGTGAR